MATEYSPIPSTVADEEEIVRRFEKIEARRELVWEMMIQGVSETKMAKELGVGRETIKSDVRYWEEKVGKHVASLKSNKSKVAEEIGNTIKRLEWIFQNAAMEYAASTVQVSKNRFLNTAMKAEIAKVKLLIETGYLPKAGLKVTVESEESVNFAAIFGKTVGALDDPIKRRKAMEVAARMITVAPTKVTTKE